MRALSTALIGGFLLGALAAGPALAEDASVTLVIKDHRFEPSQVTVPAGQRVKITVDNRDQTAEEFESHDLHVEKVVAGGKSISVFVGPLTPGSYGFFGERHEDTAKGTLVAK